MWYQITGQFPPSQATIVPNDGFRHLHHLLGGVGGGVSGAMGAGAFDWGGGSNDEFGGGAEIRRKNKD